MFDQFTDDTLTNVLPRLIYEIPFFGEVDFRISLTAVSIFMILTAIFWIIQKIVLINLVKMVSKTKNKLDDIIVGAVKNIRPWVYVLVSLYVSIQVFNLSDRVEFIVTAVFLFSLVWQLIEIATQFVKYFVINFLEKDEDGDGIVDLNSATTAHLVTLIAKITLWSLGLLFVLSNLGIEVVSLIAGLGIGGIAVALALQGVLSDLFASFSLYFDKPFRIGDYVVIGSDSGTVEKIGIKSTRLRTPQGQELVISNAELTSARVQNFKKMQERRVVTKIGITYETPQIKVKEVAGIVKRIFEALDGARLDRVHFTTFGDSALIFEIVFYVESSNYAEYLDIQEVFNFDLIKRFAELGIDFAYPTQTIYTKVVN